MVPTVKGTVRVGMTETFHERLRRQIEECFKEPTSVPEPVQAVLATLEETVGEAELALSSGHVVKVSEVTNVTEMLAAQL